MLFYYIQNDYDASEMNSSSPFEWKFDNGNSAGVCNVNIPSGNPYYEADTSDLRQPFDDGFVKFNVSADGVAGSNVVPYLPQAFFNPNDPDPDWKNKYRFHQIWFKNNNPGVQNPDYDNKEDNYWHLIGASQKSGVLGITRDQANCSFAFIKTIETDCNFNPIRSCTDLEKENLVRCTTAHELTHQFLVDDEAATDWAWCGNPAPPPDAPAYTCGHPNGVFPPPNDNVNGENCLMSPTDYKMDTDGVDRLDCCLLNSNVCQGEPGGRTGIRDVSDPQ